MDLAKEIKNLIIRAMSPPDATSKKRQRTHSENQDDVWAACRMAFPALTDGSLIIANAEKVMPRKGWRALGTCAYPFACHRCHTRYPKGTQNVWVTGERGSPLTYECGSCHGGGPRLPGM